MKNNAVIFGDSYSTFEGFIPDGYETYYSQSELSKTDVRQVDKTWWHQVIKDANLNLILNNSWSGSTIGYIGWGGRDYSQSASFICRFRKLIEEGFFKENRVDTVFVFGGTNDSWSNAPLGEEKYSDWKENDLYSALPAISYFLNLVKQTLPQAKIYCLINTGLKDEITSCMKTASEKYGITYVTFEDIDKNDEFGHPTIKGMETIKNKVLEVMGK